jgi:hypothetical protein
VCERDQRWDHIVKELMQSRLVLLLRIREKEIERSDQHLDHILVWSLLVLLLRVREREKEI